MQRSCTITNSEVKPWWRVDLLNAYNISSVAVTNRRDCCSERINGAEIHIGNSLEDNGNSNPVCAVITSISAGRTETYECNGMVGQYVTISIDKVAILTLCEVEVYGSAEDSNICADCTSTPGSHNYTCLQGYHVIVSGSIPSTSNPCEDIDECVPIPCGSNAVCFNTPGSFYCTCADGYISSSGLTWEPGITVCQSKLVTEENLTVERTLKDIGRYRRSLFYLFPSQGQSREMFFLSEINKDLENNTDLILSEEAVTGVLNTALSVTDNMFPLEGKGGTAEIASIILKISEGLASALVQLLVEPQESNTESWKTVKTPTMGSAAAVLMSVSGMEKLMSPSFFKSEKVTEMYSDIIIAMLTMTRHMELPEPVNFTVHHKKDVWGGDEWLEVVNLFCMCVGLAFLAIAILTFLLCRWNPKINNTARLHLSICLFLGHLLFLVAVSRTENAVVCAVIAGLLHFLFLSGFVWMLLETVQLFLLVRSLSKVQIIQKEGLKPLYLLLIGYGAPMVVVGISAAVFSDGYGSKDALIVFKIVAQFFILGCAWILGFFQSSLMFKYLFIILNSQQGTFIFIVHCLLNKEVTEPSQENVAFGKKATQTILTNAYKAIDGRHQSLYQQGSCSYTYSEVKPWWRVDLLNAHKISSVAVTNRGDCCSWRINGAEIRIGNSLEDNGTNVCRHPHVLAGPWRNIAFNSTDFPRFPLCDSDLAGRWVRFSGILGDVIPESCVGSGTSGSRYSAYLGFAHPQLEEGIIEGVIHLKSSENCFTGSVDRMQVLACPEGHYVYRLPLLLCPAVFPAQIDECAEDPNLCGPNADCTNTNGSHICTCHLGYHVIGSVPSTSSPCEDMDECVAVPCGSNAACFNTLASFYCTCADGYIASSGLAWESGITVCLSSQDYLASLTPPEGQSREMFFLSEINKDLENNPDLILPEKTVTGVLNTALSVTGNIPPTEGKGGTAETANIVLKISEGLVSTLIEPESQENNTESRKTVKTPTMGSAAAVLMSVSGMEELMSPSFFQSENVTEIYSDIITATLPKTRHMELPEPVNFTVHHKKKLKAGMMTCVYWEDKGEETQWSVDGCTASFSNETHTVCSCTHLSTFAILLQTEGQEEEEEDPLLETINLFCMCVGLAFLAVAILTFLLCSWNPKVNNTARLHLCICLFLGHLLFLVAVSRTENAVVCAVIAGVLHFLFLSGFMWMLLETLQLFLLVRSLSKVQIIHKEGLKALYLLLIGYGAPMVVVGISAAVFSDGYGSKDACWLKKERDFHWSFIGPVCAILTLNLVSFGVIIWKLQPTLANMKSDVSQSRDTRLIIFKIVAQFFVLGCAWILGFYQSSILLKYLFIILNSQQGTFLFIVHCLLNKEAIVTAAWLIVDRLPNAWVKENIDECGKSTTFCDSNADCVNTVGAYNCSCHQGYQTPNDTRASLSNTCQDIDECVEEPDICGPNADCANTVGAHTCTCHQGFIVLPEGSMANTSNPCRDIDECALDICGPNSTCTNTIGNYTCACQQGYDVFYTALMISVTNPCLDIDECLQDPPICGSNGDCTNSIGSYICDCQQGYLNSLLADASEPCEDIDECVPNSCGLHTVCYNTPASFYCTCAERYMASTGFTWEFGVTVCQILLVTDDISTEDDPTGNGEVASIFLKVCEGLMTTLIEPTITESRKLVKTPTIGRTQDSKWD
ncbi:hypothetical protein SKAU_G00300020 [Synaphobranchus kaupii]|uniref:Uncharacterized protein n=1 Tax=Synaphobranchus kaupii TaxID=118154 RepID=A0A9Q1IMX9_SYNKA|nr:hypothetical protein SKAU_G00300020 [Synaphobranchus kaupii]